MRSISSVLAEWTPHSADFACVQLTETRGSTPRESGTFMLVGETWQAGTVGGGTLEWDCLQYARYLLRSDKDVECHEFVLGNGTNQCCGGRAKIKITRSNLPMIETLKQQLCRDEESRKTVLLFGAGHVGRALAYALAPLPLKLVWVDPRQDEFGTVPSGVEMRVTSDWERELTLAPQGSGLLVLTPNHSLDALIVAAALERNDFAYIGLIGSKTKRRRFENSFREVGLTEEQIKSFICPIGDRNIRDKRPEIIAALVAAEIVEKLLHAA